MTILATLNQKGGCGKTPPESLPNLNFAAIKRGETAIKEEEGNE